MKGKYHIEISNRKLHYQLDIERKVTVIKGNSGTGKTTLIRMIQGFQEQGNKSGIRVKNESNIPLVVFSPSTNWEYELLTLKNHIIFVDEAVDFLYTKAFQIAFAQSDNYIVIISRSGRFTHIPYSVHSIYQLKSQKEQPGTLTRMYRIYQEKIVDNDASVIITEDQNAGKEMMEQIYHGNIVSANGNGNIASKMMSYTRSTEKVTSIVDGAAFGGFIAKTLAIAKNHENIKIYTPESFEYLLLCTDMFKNHLTTELTQTWDNCDASKYLTWEQYYTDLLKRLCREYYQIDYSKSRLNAKLVNSKIKEQIRQELDQYCITESE